MRNPITMCFLSLALVLATSSTCVAQTTIFGGYDCGQWVNRPKGHPMESWVTGYLSGLNSMYTELKETPGIAPIDPLDQLNSMDQAYVWLDNFCKANPLRALDGAARELYIELRVKAVSQAIR